MSDAKPVDLGAGQEEERGRFGKAFEKQLEERRARIDVETEKQRRRITREIQQDLEGRERFERWLARAKDASSAIHKRCAGPG